MPMLSPNTLVIHGCGIVFESVEVLMVVSAILIHIQVFPLSVPLSSMGDCIRVLINSLIMLSRMGSVKGFADGSFNM